MGNVCCIGRAQPQIPPTEGRKNSQRASKKLKQLTEIKTTTTLKQSNPQQPFFELPDSPKSSHDSHENYNTVKILSNRSDAYKTLTYTIISAEDLTISQQKQVINVLDQYKHLIEPDEQEMVDGFLHVQVESSYLMMITTHAIYLLNPVNLVDVNKRVQLEDISFILLTNNKEFVGFVENSVKGCLKVVCQDFDSLVFAVQQVCFEAFNQYLPWVVVDDIQKIKDQDIDKKVIMGDRNLAIFKVFVEHGRIGEVAKIIEKCNNSGENRMMTVHLVVSNENIYMLDSSLDFMDMIPFTSIKNSVYKDKECLLEIKGQGKTFSFIIDSGTAKKVIEMIS